MLYSTFLICPQKGRKGIHATLLFVSLREIAYTTTQKNNGEKNGNLHEVRRTADFAAMVFFQQNATVYVFFRYMWRSREAIEKKTCYFYVNGVARIHCHAHPSDSHKTKKHELQNFFFFPFQKHIEEASQVLSDACDTITRFRRKTGIADSIVGIVKKCAVFKKYFLLDALFGFFYLTTNSNSPKNPIAGSWVLNWP